MDKDERDKEIAGRYRTGISAPQLAREYALSVPAIRKILGQQGATKGNREVVEQEDTKVKSVLGRVHEKLGQDLVYHRMFVLDQSRKAVAEKLGWTSQKLTSIEAGIYDVTLVDLLDLSDFLGKDISELIKK